MKNIDMPTLQNMAAKCELCDLCKGRLNPVFARGNANSDIVVCGMCPGPDENKEGYPFVEYAKAGSVLNTIITDSFGHHEALYITNLVKCFVQPGIKLDPEWMNRCLPYFIVQLQLLEPKVIITLGRDVANFLLNNEAKMGAMRMRTPFNYLGTKLIATYHPSYLARGGGVNHRDYKKVVEDFNRARKFI
jgi:uracil-DNA glycosylase family 4